MKFISMTNWKGQEGVTGNSAKMTWRRAALASVLMMKMDLHQVMAVSLLHAYYFSFFLSLDFIFIFQAMAAPCSVSMGILHECTLFCVDYVNWLRQRCVNMWSAFYLVSFSRVLNQL